MLNCNAKPNCKVAMRLVKYAPLNIQITQKVRAEVLKKLWFSNFPFTTKFQILVWNCNWNCTTVCFCIYCLMAHQNYLSYIIIIIIIGLSPYFLFKQGSNLRWSFSIFLNAMPHSSPFLLVPHLHYIFQSFPWSSYFPFPPILPFPLVISKLLSLLTWPSHCNFFCFNLSCIIFKPHLLAPLHRRSCPAISFLPRISTFQDVLQFPCQCLCLSILQHNWPYTTLINTASYFNGILLFVIKLTITLHFPCLVHSWRTCPGVTDKCTLWLINWLL